MLSNNYADNQSLITDVAKYAAAIDNTISVGLGAGDPNQSKMVAEISAQLQPQHINQVFIGVATSRALLG
nr:KDGP aldolase [Orbus hercynius]